MKRRLKIAFILTLLLIALLLGYRSYLLLFKPPFTDIHAENIEAIKDSTQEKEDSITFAAGGNINNSIGLFERQMIPMINGTDPDFFISAGNAVSGGGEDKYRALYQSLGRLNAPYLLTVGENESSVFGSFNFYEHYGPYFFSFQAAGSQFIFLDSTDPDTYAFQLQWLRTRLREPGPANRFVFLSKPLFPIGEDLIFPQDEAYLEDTEFRDSLHTLFQNHGVDAVFSSSLPLYSRQERGGVDYLITGGAGGLVLNNGTSFYHYLLVTAGRNGSVDISMERVDIGQNQILRTLESLWFLIHSFFYTSHINFLLGLGLLILLSLKLYSLIFTEPQYYKNYNLNLDAYRNKPLRIAMITNNYYPFIGGVPISIDRLRRGLEQQGHQVCILAPSYPENPPDPAAVRIPTLFRLSRNSDFRLANPFSPSIRRSLRTFQPDLIHIHHPFWLGWIGLIQAKALKVPAVLTYHTRLEEYAHYVPLPTNLFRNLISHTAVRRFANRCTGVIVPTDSARDYLRMIGVKSSLAVHPTGIDFSRFHPPASSQTTSSSQTAPSNKTTPSSQSTAPPTPAELRRRHGLRENEKILISVSRLSREKNIDFLLQAAAELRRRSPFPFRCLLIGGGNQEESIRSRIQELELEATFLLTGKIPPEQMPAYYRLADLFVFASKSETQGMVILEAMAAGLPVTAVRSSGIDDVVKNGVNGFKTAELITPWVEAVEKILGSRDLYQNLSQQAVQTARNHDIPASARSIAGTYAEFLALYHAPEP